MSEALKSTFPSAAGQELDQFTWRPQGQPKAVIQLVHGMAEHMARYDAPGKALAQAGYLVVGHTHLGHGERAETPGYFGRNGWDALLSDIHSLRVKTQEEYPGLPYFILGHSMGSFLTRCYLTDHSQGLKGAVISGTGYYGGGVARMGILLCSLYILFGKGMRPARLVDRLAFSGGNKQFKDAKTPSDWLSRDREQVQRYIDDPLCGFVFTAWGYRDLFTGLKRLASPQAAAAVRKDLPILFFSGDQDPVGQNGEGVRRVAREFTQSGNSRVTVKLYPGGRHEMFNELNRREVFQDLIAWLDGQLG